MAFPMSKITHSQPLVHLVLVFKLENFSKNVRPGLRLLLEQRRSFFRIVKRSSCFFLFFFFFLF